MSRNENVRGLLDACGEVGRVRGSTSALKSRTNGVKADWSYATESGRRVSSSCFEESETDAAHDDRSRAHVD